MSALNTPDGLKLRDGSVVELARFPGTKWVLHEGWYNYNDQQYQGWYFASIPFNTILPASKDDLRLIKRVFSADCDCYTPQQVGPNVPINSGCNCGHDSRPPMIQQPPHNCHPSHTPPPPPPPGCGCGDNVPFTSEMAYQVSRSFIVVETYCQLQELASNCAIIPDGRVVKVNKTDTGESAYYSWDAKNHMWVIENFGSDMSDVYTKEESDARFVTYSQLKQEVADQIKQADLSDPVKQVIKTDDDIKAEINTLINNSETITNIQTTINEALSWNDIEEITN